MIFFFFSSRRRHTRWNCDWSSDVCSSDLTGRAAGQPRTRVGEQLSALFSLDAKDVEKENVSRRTSRVEVSAPANSIAILVAIDAALAIAVAAALLIQQASRAIALAAGIAAVLGIVVG